MVETDDGAYVVKFTENPQGTRILINELFCYLLLQQLKINVPEPALVDVTREFVDNYPGVNFTVGSSKIRVKPGIHFGSRVSVDHETDAIFDFAPDSLLRRLSNLSDFLGILVFDKWVGNSDSRQALFFNGKRATRIAAAYRHGRCVQMIDHGAAFNGASWDFLDSHPSGIYFKSAVYRDVTSIASFQPWLDLIRGLSAEFLQTAASSIPAGWFDGSEAEFGRLLDRLHSRQTSVARQIERMRISQPNIFPNWRTFRDSLHTMAPNRKTCKVGS